MFPLAALVLVLAPPQEETVRKLTSIAEVLDYQFSSPDDRPAVDCKAQVTVWAPSFYMLLVQSENRGMYITQGSERPSDPETVLPPGIQPGDWVRIRGSAGPGAYSPIVFRAKVEKIQSGDLPAPAYPPSQNLLDDRYENVRVRIRGEVLRTSFSPGVIGGRDHTFFRLNAGGHQLDVEVLDFRFRPGPELIGAQMEVTGSLATSPDGHRRKAGVRVIALTPQDFRVIRASRPDWTKPPVHRIDSLLTRGSRTRIDDTVRIAGSVTWTSPQRICVEDPSGGIFVDLASPVEVRVGDGVEVLGKVSRDIDIGSFILADALHRRATFPVPAVNPKPHDAHIITNPIDGGRLVRLEAQLVGSRRSGSLDVFELRIAEQTVVAQAAHHDKPFASFPYASLQPGDIVEVSGVAMFHVPPFAFPELHLLLRAPTEIRFVSGPSWVHRVPWVRVAIGGGLILVMVLAWVFFLRRQVATRTSELQSSNRRLQSLYDARTRFLADMSHEIRTPMNGIIGMNRMLLETPLSSEQKDCAEAVRSCGEHMLRVLDDILDFSKIEAGRLTVLKKQFDLTALLSQIAGLARPAAGARGLALTLELPPATGQKPVFGDPDRIRQIVMNFVSNALKFTEAGSVAIRLRSAEGGRFRIEVQDSGIGMSEDQCRRIFQRFEQTDDRIGRRYGGTGLGLAISQRLAQLMDGSVGVSSVTGQGSCFWLELPLVDPGGPGEFCLLAQQAPAVPPSPQEAAKLPVGLHILLVEDNRINQRVARRVLEKLACRVDVADNGRICLQMAESTHYDAILMDCHMPEMDGFKATRRLRASGYPAPVIALTAAALAEERKECLAAGMDDILIKPVRPDALEAALRRWCVPTITQA